MIEAFWCRMPVELLDRQRWRTRLGRGEAEDGGEDLLLQATIIGSSKLPSFESLIRSRTPALVSSLH